MYHFVRAALGKPTRRAPPGWPRGASQPRPARAGAVLILRPQAENRVPRRANTCPEVTRRPSLVLWWPQEVRAGTGSARLSPKAHTPTPGPSPPDQADCPPPARPRCPAQERGGPPAADLGVPRPEPGSRARPGLGGRSAGGPGDGAARPLVAAAGGSGSAGPPRRRRRAGATAAEDPPPRMKRRPGLAPASPFPQKGSTFGVKPNFCKINEIDRDTRSIKRERGALALGTRREKPGEAAPSGSGGYCRGGARFRSDHPLRGAAAGPPGGAGVEKDSPRPHPHPGPGPAG